MVFSSKHSLNVKAALLLGCFSLFTYSSAFAETKDVTNETVNDLVISTESGTDVLNINDAGVSNKATVNTGGTININNNGSAVDTVVNADGVVNIYNGGSATNTTVNEDGEVFISNGGTATNTTINEYGDVTVNNGGKITDTTIEDGGDLTVEDGGVANKTTINDGGYMDVESGAVVNTTTINAGGEAYVNGTIDATTVNNEGELYIAADGKATNTTVKNGGLLNALSEGAKVTGADFEAGGKFDFSTNATVSDLSFGGVDSTASIEDKVASGFKVEAGSSLTATGEGIITSSGILGGMAIVSDGGTIADTTIGDGGTLVLKNGSANIGENVVITASGKVDMSTNASFENLNINGNIISIVGQKAENATLGTGSTLTIESGGSSNKLKVDGGELILNTNGTAIDTTVTAGKFTVNDGTVDTLTVSGSGVVNASGGTLSTKPESGSGGEGSEEPEATVKVSDGGIINISGTVKADGILVGNNGTLNIDNGTANKTDIDGGTVNVNTGGSLYMAEISNGGQIKAAAGANVGTLTLTNNTTLTTTGSATVDNLTAQKGAILNLAADTVLGGDLKMDVAANASGSALQFDNLFVEGTLLNSLEVDGGTNAAFKGKLVNTSSADKKLILSNGSYTVSDSGQNGTVEVGGWNVIDVNNSTVRLESDITMSGTEKNFNVSDSAVLDVSGTLDNVINVTIGGNLKNAGLIDFTTKSDSAKDTLTVGGNFEGVDGSIINLNINPKEGTSDKLVINGNVSGTTSLYMKTTTGSAPTGNITFAEATGTGSADAFKIWRVEGSPFHWDVLFENNKWYGFVTDSDSPSIVPETAAYYGLIDNTFMQTASLGANLRNNIALSELRKVPCDVPSNLKYTNRTCRSSRPVFTGWVAPVYSTATIEAPYNYIASVSGLDGGLDLISNGYTKFGLLASYRHGLYKFEESGENYTINGEAETVLDSYLGGAYFRVDGSSWSILAAAYGGMIDASVDTTDGVKATSSGTTFGATLDVTYIWQNIDGIKIQPGVRISYTSVKMDEIEDNVGKKQEFDNASRIEAEAGIRLAKVWDFSDARAEIFVKPALVQTTNNSGTFELIEERYLDDTEDRTLIKMETGMSFNMMGNWSASLSGSYSFGSDYNNATAGLSLIYNF